MSGSALFQCFRPSTCDPVIASGTRMRGSEERQQLPPPDSWVNLVLCWILETCSWFLLLRKICIRVFGRAHNCKSSEKEKHLESILQQQLQDSCVFSCGHSTSDFLRLRVRLVLFFIGWDHCSTKKIMVAKATNVPLLWPQQNVYFHVSLLFGLWMESHHNKVGEKPSLASAFMGAWGKGVQLKHTFSQRTMLSNGWDRNEKKSPIACLLSDGLKWVFIIMKLNFPSNALFCCLPPPRMTLYFSSWNLRRFPHILEDLIARNRLSWTDGKKLGRIDGWCQVTETQWPVLEGHFLLFVYPFMCKLNTSRKTSVRDKRFHAEYGLYTRTAGLRWPHNFFWSTRWTREKIPMQHTLPRTVRIRLAEAARQGFSSRHTLVRGVVSG